MNIDNELDFSNSLKDRMDTLTDDDFLLAICINRKDDDSLGMQTALHGDSSKVAALLMKESIEEYDDPDSIMEKQTLKAIIITWVQLWVSENDEFKEEFNNGLKLIEDFKETM